MKKTLLLFCMLYCLGEALFAQVPTAPGSYQWVKGFGSANQASGEDEKITTMKFDHEGNILVCGQLTGYAHIQGLGGKKDSLISNRWQNSTIFVGFLTKYDCNGNVIWHRQINDSVNSTAIYDFVFDSLGNIYAFANCNIGAENIYFNDSLFAPFSFTPSIQGPGAVLKIDKLGRLCWVWGQPYNATNVLSMYAETYLSSGNLTANSMVMHHDTINLMVRSGGAFGPITIQGIKVYSGLNLFRFTQQGQLVDISILDSLGYFKHSGYNIDKQGNYIAVINFLAPTNKFLDSVYNRPTASQFNPLSTIIKFNRSKVLRHIEAYDSASFAMPDFSNRDNEFYIRGGGGIIK